MKLSVLTKHHRKLLSAVLYCRSRPPQKNVLILKRDVGSISNLGARHFRVLFLKQKGVFSKNEKGTPSFIAKFWGAHASSAPQFLHL